LSFALVLPPYDPACGDYLAVGTEVRIASTDDVDIDSPTCDDLRNNSRYADCFHRLSQIRIWNDGNADSQPRVPEVSLTGGCGSPGDAYISALPPASNSCKYDVTVKVNWGTRSENSTNVPANFKVTANGTTNVPVSDWVSGGVSTYETTGGAITATPGANPVTISLNWTDTDKNHSWNGPCSNQKDNPCKYSGTDGHQAFVGTTATAGAVNLVRTSETATVNGVPGSAFANHRSGGAGFDCNDTDTCSIFPTIGTGSVLKTGVLTTLRLDDPQANQSVFCDPDETQAYPVFRVGCKPWFAKNSWASPWWIDGSGGDKTCPDPGKWYSYADKGFGFGVNSANNPWECVLTAPGVKTGQVGDDIAIATKNCNDDKNNSCQVNSFACNYDGNYDGKPLSPNGWTGDSRYPRVVGLFIVPYQSAKGLTGNGDPIPVLGFASFYVMNWTGSSKKQSDPCPDPDWDNDGNPATPQVPVPDPPPGAITGVFVEAVDYQPGPVDPHATCVEGQLGQCRAVLVR
jgi:hypothetical protein